MLNLILHEKLFVNVWEVWVLDLPNTLFGCQLLFLDGRNDEIVVGSLDD